MKGIDHFAGIGGSTAGAEAAGVRMIWAANHWQSACDVYEANHGVKPKCQDLHQVAWETVPRHDIMLTSPSCTGHTRARGKERRRHDAARCTAFAPLACAEVHRPFAFILENVPEFLDWVLWPSIRAGFEALGYQLTLLTIDAADHGVPQNRVRLFIVGVRSRLPVELVLPKRRHVPVRTILDPKTGSWSKIRAMCLNTRSRVAQGRRDFGSEFIMPYYGSGSGLTGRSLDRPIGTITTLDRWAIVQGDEMRMLNVDEVRRAMGFPRDYILPQGTKLAKHMLGNAVCPPVMRDVLNALKKAA